MLPAFRMCGSIRLLPVGKKATLCTSSMVPGRTDDSGDSTARISSTLAGLLSFPGRARASRATSETWVNPVFCFHSLPPKVTRPPLVGTDLSKLVAVIRRKDEADGQALESQTLNGSGEQN
jgi:hypothetical protein